MQADPGVAQLVIIGAGGGAEALVSLVATLPVPFPAPIVVVRRYDEGRADPPEGLLARAGALPVRVVTDPTPLEPGVIFLAPPGRDLVLADRALRPAPDGERPAGSSLDRLLAGAAPVYGDRLIAVLLAGGGADGADGARAVAAAGGTVIVQDPATAGEAAPLALAPTAVDAAVDLGAIGPLLADLLAEGTPPPELEDGLRALLERVRARSGIDFSAYKPATILRRLRRRMVDTGAATLDQYAEYLGRHPEEYGRLAANFLIKVTDFFRDADLFEYLRAVVLPALVAEARGRGNELRLWSAGCATGEEAYSLAILVAEALGDELDDFTVRIFATDLDAEAVAFARRGVYPTSALGALPPALRERYFTPLDGAHEVKRRLRGLVVLAHHDLGQRAPFPRIDLALCRNVLIYFAPELQRRVLQLLAFSLRPGGRLALGKSESTGPLAEYFALESPRLKVYRRSAERLVLPPGLAGGLAPAPHDRRAPAGMEWELARARRAGLPARGPAERAEQLLNALPVGVVAVDRQYDIESINAAARRLLGIHAIALGQDFVHLAERLPSDRLRASLDAALRGEPRTEEYEITSLAASPGATLHLSLSTAPAGGQQQGGRVSGAVVTIQDITELARETRRLEAESSASRAEAGRLAALLAEAHAAARELAGANQELAALNAVLRVRAEELQVANEEAQATAEEIETLSEEQQATNEELETLNEELQATVEELNTTNEDLAARSGELEAVAASREAERRQLARVLAGMADAVLVVDAAGAVVLTNPACERLFGGTPTDLLDDAGAPLAPDATPQARAARGETFAMRFARRGAAGEPSRFEARGMPADGEGLRGVVVIRALDGPPT